MIRCFLKSRIVMALGCAATLVAAVAIVVRRMGQPLWMTAITVLLLLALGVAVTRLLANMLAANEHQKLLAVLYVELDPNHFLEQYAGVLKLLKKETVTSTTATAYWADGLCAAGRYEEALMALEHCTIPQAAQSALMLECLLHDSVCHCLLQKGDTDAAAAAMSRYDEVLRRTKQEKPQLAENLAEKYASFQQELYGLQGKPVDLESVESAIQHSPIRIRRLELTLLRARELMRIGEHEQAQKCCGTVIEEGGKLVLSEQAQKLKQQMEAETEPRPY